MARALWSGSLSFGLVNVPVQLITAARDLDYHFNELHEKDKVRIEQRRFCSKEDVEVGGHQFKTGDKMIMFYNSANRDESVFKDADTFDIGRDPNPHYGFGAPGPHFCLGAHLARREISVAFRKMFEQMPDLEVAGEPARLKSSFINGIKRMPVRLTGSL